MANKTTPENTLGQHLICLRMSKLNYVVKETPYSAFVTIRKKFVKSLDKDVFESEIVVKDDNLKELERENFHQKQKVKELEKECAMLQFEKEELEIKLEAVEKKNFALDDQIEVEMDVSREKERVIKDLKTKHAKCKENSDNILILEYTLKNRDDEIKRLKDEISNLGKVYFECKDCKECFETDG